MAYNNFKQTFWSKYIQTELPKFTVFKEFSDYKFEGEIQHGNILKIQGIARPTIGTYTQGTPITPETVADSTQSLLIDQQKYFDFLVDDIDKAQAKEGLMETLTKEATIALAEDIDTYIASLVPDGTVIENETAITTADAAIAALDEAYTSLWDAGVPNSERTQIVVKPWFYQLIKEKLISVSTDNPDYIKRGVVGLYNNGEVKISNNIYNDGTYDNMCIRTKRGIAVASQIDKIEAFRPHDSFSDALKGLHVYGAKVVRPQEVICLQAKKA